MLYLLIGRWHWVYLQSALLKVVRNLHHIVDEPFLLQCHSASMVSSFVSVFFNDFLGVHQGVQLITLLRACILDLFYFLSIAFQCFKCQPTQELNRLAFCLDVDS